MDKKLLIRQILKELAQAQCSCMVEFASCNITRDCAKIKEEIEQYAKELGVKPPDFNWSIYILKEEK